LYIPVIPVLRRLRQEDLEIKGSLRLPGKFKSSLGYMARPCLKKKDKPSMVV
jgi:hypothetical protein